VPSLLRSRSGVDHLDDDGTGGRPSRWGGVDPRFEARRLELLSGRRRRRRRQALAVMVVAGLVAAGVWATHTSALDVDALEVTGGVHTSRDEIVAASGLAVGQRLADVDAGRAQAGIEALPWVAGAAVDRSWAGTVTITVTERLAAALLADGAGGWLAVDDQGRVLAPIGEIDPALIIHLDGVAPAAPGAQVDERARSGIAVGRALTPAERSRVSRIHLTDKGTVELVLRPRGVVWLGHPDDDLPGKAQSLQTVMAKVDLRCVQTIDVRVAQQPVLTRDPACT
jgi:cell division protein FtsQ